MAREYRELSDSLGGVGDQKRKWFARCLLTKVMHSTAPFMVSRTLKFDPLPLQLLISDNQEA